MFVTMVDKVALLHALVAHNPVNQLLTGTDIDWEPVRAKESSAEGFRHAESGDARKTFKVAKHPGERLTGDDGQVLSRSVTGYVRDSRLSRHKTGSSRDSSDSEDVNTGQHD